MGGWGEGYRVRSRCGGVRGIGYGVRGGGVRGIGYMEWGWGEGYRVYGVGVG